MKSICVNYFIECDDRDKSELISTSVKTLNVDLDCIYTEDGKINIEIVYDSSDSLSAKDAFDVDFLKLKAMISKKMNAGYINYPVNAFARLPGGRIVK